MRPSAIGTSRLVWLLDFRFAGQTYRLAESEIDAPTGEAGATERYESGLEAVDIEDGVALFAESPPARSASVSAHLGSRVDIAAMVADGWDLTSATARLWLFVEDGDERDLRAVLDGVVLDPEYASADEPLTFTLSEEIADAPGRIPALTQRYDGSSWVSPFAPEYVGEWYPIIFGRPGGGSEDGSPVIQVGADLMLIAGHGVEAASVTIYDEEDDLEESFTVTHERDDRGERVAVVDVSGAAVITVTGIAPFWARWDTQGGMKRADAEVRGAGGVMRWMLERSGARYDAGRLDAAAAVLDSYFIDAAVLAAPDRRISPLDWIRDHLSPILPMSMRLGPDGLYPCVWRWDATTADSVARIDADAGLASRETAVSFSSRDQIANDIEIAYRRSARLDKHMARLHVSGDPDIDARRTLATDLSHRRYGRRERSITTDVVAEDATAAKVLTWLGARYALPSRVCRWSVGHEMAWLEPGAIVTVADSEIGIADEIGLVESVLLRAAPTISVTVRILPSPERRGQ